MIFYPLTVYLDMLIAIAVVMFVMCLLWGERRIHVAARWHWSRRPPSSFCSTWS